VLILDDGFQHRRVQRDCDVVLIHARMPLGGWALLLRGPMREPLAALARAHIVIITKADEALELVGALTERLRALAPGAAVVTAAHEPVELFEPASGRGQVPSQLSGWRVGLLSSIGDPAGFEATVRRLQATVSWHRALPDHHRYAAADWVAVQAAVRNQRVDAVLTTEKDWVRLAPVAAHAAATEAPVWVLRVAMRVLSGEAELDARLAGLRTG
jgi:tetraacyldisaccharide 4'-kinase